MEVECSLLRFATGDGREAFVLRCESLLDFDLLFKPGRHVCTSTEMLLGALPTENLNLAQPARTRHETDKDNGCFQRCEAQKFFAET